MDNNQNKYIALYNSTKLEVVSDTTYNAQKQAAKLLKVSPKNQYKISIHLVELAGKPVSIPTDF